MAGQSLDITALMPGHWAHSRPRHRVRQRGESPCWRIRFSAAATAAGRMTLAALLFIGGHSGYRRAVRGAFLSPWFAVSLGIIVAASLSMAAPRAALTFPPSKAGRCVPAGCANTRHSSGSNQPSPPVRPARRHRRLLGRPLGRPHGRPLGRTHGRPLGRPHGRTLGRPRLPHSPATLALARRIASGPPKHDIVLRYGLLHSDRRGFMAMIAITGRKPLGKWALRFAMPGARIKIVMWARWAIETSGEFVAVGDPSPWPRSAPDQARIVILGTGRPQRPKDCHFDGSTCTLASLRQPLDNINDPDM